MMFASTIVTSKDGIQFVVQTAGGLWGGNIEKQWAATQTAAQLEEAGGFTRLNSLDALVPANPAPKPAKPKFTLIKGGKE
jgi:hypothetical protein